MENIRIRVLSALSAISLLFGMLTSTGLALPTVAEGVTVVQDFENGTEGFTSWLVDSHATWNAETKNPLSGGTSLNLHTSNIAGCYVNFPAAIGVKNIAVRVKVIGHIGVVRIGANGNNAHYKGSESTAGYHELTTSAFTFTDLYGNVLPNAAYYDAAWGGIRFAADFDGYIFIKNENNVDVQSVNVGIFHGSTNEEGMTLLLDDFATYTGTDYAAIVQTITAATNVVSAVTKQNFETGADGFTAWMVDGNATWKLDKIAPLAGTASLRLSTSSAAGCYVNFPAEIGEACLAVRLKVSGNTGVVRIGANGANAHYKSDGSSLGYFELTATDIVFTDLSGNVLTDAGYYDAPWGGIRFNGEFDGYLFLRNENKIDISTVNVGIFHGSTNAEGMTVSWDSFTAYSNHTERSFSAIATQLNQDVPTSEAPSFALGIESVPAGTKDVCISDSFDGTVLDDLKWEGAARLHNGAVQVPATGLLSVYRQKATAEKPLLVRATYQAMANGAGLALYLDESHYAKVYYEDGVWYYAVCAGGGIQKQILLSQIFLGGSILDLLYDGIRIVPYVNGRKLATLVLPNSWSATGQYRIKLLGASTVSDLHVAGGVYTAIGRDAGMSDDFNAAVFDANKWETASIGYIVNGTNIGHPGTVKPTVQDGRLVVSGVPDNTTYWSGLTLYTSKSQQATEYNPVSFEVTRVAAVFQPNNPPAMVTGIGIYVDNQNFFQFALNSQASTKWQWGGMVNGNRFVAEAHSAGSTNNTAYRFRLVYDGKTVQCYVDGYLITTVSFDVGGVNVHGSVLAFPSHPTSSSGTVSAVYDDFVTTGLVANPPSTAEKQAAALGDITQPTRWDEQVQLPQLTPGFCATLTNIQPAGYLDENGNILKRGTQDITIQAQVKVYDERNDQYVLTEPMPILLQSDYTPSILQDELAAGKLPNQVLGGESVKGLQNPFIDEKRLHLPRPTYVWTSPDNDISCPVLPEGFVSELVASSHLSVIALDGTVIPPAKETVVTVDLKITQTATGASETRPYTVTVPAASGHGEWDNYKDNKVGMFIHYMNGQLYNNGSAAHDKDEMANAFDVEGVVASAVKWKVDYIQLTAWHGDWIVLYPSEVQKAYGMVRYTQRDLIGDLLDELDAANKKYGTNIELYLYTHPGQGVALHAIDKHSVGWGDYDKYNTYLVDLYYELVSRYTNRANGKQGLSGLYFDEGSPQGDMDLFIDYPRLRDACKRAYTDLVLIQNTYENLYSQDVPNHEVWPAAGTPYSVSFRTNDVNGWEAYNNGGYSIVLTGGWNPSSAVTNHSVVTSQYTLYNMFRYTVLLASVNTEGGGVAWAFSNYAQSATSKQLWETGVDEAMTAFATYYGKYRESLYGTVPGQAYVTASMNGVTNLARVAQTGTNTWGVSTDTKDGKTTYLHVLFPPQGNVLELAKPANGTIFRAAALVGRSDEVKLEQTATGGYRLTLPEGFVWDPVDTVVALSADVYAEEGDTVVATETVGTSAFTMYKLPDGSHKLVVSGTGVVSAWTELVDYGETLKTIVVEEGLTAIGHGVFQNLPALEKVTLPTTLTTISAAAFNNDKKLADINLDEGLITIGYKAFFGTGLTEVTVPDSVTSMGTWAFAACKELTSVTFGASNLVKRALPARAFSGCSALKKVDLGTKLRTIDDYAFFNTGLETLYIPANVKVIDNAAFYSCSSLKTVEIASGGATYLGWASFYRCTALESVDLGDSVTNISTWVFTACANLKEIQIPETVTNIGRRTFCWCASLESITLPSGLTSIKPELFFGCTKLSEVIMSADVTEIGSKAFYKCKALTSLEYPESATVAADAFLNSGIK